MSRIEELALAAVSTPSSSAPDALDVLVDALLEAGQLPAGGVDGWQDAPCPEWREPTFGLRRRALVWAKRRLAPELTGEQRILARVTELLDEHQLPPAVVGVVGPFVLRVHFPMPVGPEVLDAARAALAGRLIGPITVEMSRAPDP
jgi:hypothetical protein